MTLSTWDRAFTGRIKRDSSSCQSSSLAQRVARIPELDGVRALAVVFVLIVHVTYGRISGGFLGVDLFFVLSGYLITMLLLKEHARLGAVNLRHFYARRMLRIMPPLAIAVVLGVLLNFCVGTHSGDNVKRVTAVLLFYANFLPPEVMGNLVHTWSLAIEEQFYLFWPALMLGTLRWRRMAPIIVASTIVFCSVGMRAWMSAHIEDPNVIYTFTLSRLDGIMLGSLLALIEPNLTNIARVLGERCVAFIGWVSFLGLLAMLILGTRSMMQTEPLGFLAFSFLAALFVFAVPRMPKKSPLRGGLLARGTQWLGQRSYGLYLYHYPIFIAIEVLRVPGDLINFGLVVAAKITLSLTFSEIAWRFVERPILKLKGRYAAASA